MTTDFAQPARSKQASFGYTTPGVTKLSASACWALAFVVGGATPAFARVPQVPVQATAGCDFGSFPQVVWFGSERRMTMRQLAAYAAPVFWFSPDEPSLMGAQGKEILIPETLPFEPGSNAPVVYYQMNQILEYSDGDSDGPGFIVDSTDIGDSVIDFHHVGAISLKYLAYFREEQGLGGHAHDVEPVEFRIWVAPSTHPELAAAVPCDEPMYVVGVARVTGEAHGLVWYYNVLEVDVYTEFPMHMMVEEGKHGLATDKNADGYYTPGFDVNHRTNDAWGVRDIIRGGALFSGSYQAWMSKVRRPEHRVFPPLPGDSPHRQKHTRNVNGTNVYAPDNAVYELRPFPSSRRAGSDALLEEKMHEKEVEDWPEIGRLSNTSDFERWRGYGLAQKSFAISLRLGGDRGFSFVFPLFLVKNFEVPNFGGWLVHRMYLKDRLRDFGWNLMYMPSASRFFDTYVAAGAEYDVEPVTVTDPMGPTVGSWDFVFETGVKFRANITKSPLKFLAGMPFVGTEFWGLRVGIKNTGFLDIKSLTYVIEFGAGVW